VDYSLDDELVTREREINADVRIKNSPNCYIQILNKAFIPASEVGDVVILRWPLSVENTL
jgi:hypothetical protein